jgi:membrane-associated phospholipid phosphatase
LPAGAVIGSGALAPIAAYAVLPPGRSRQVTVCVLNMWVYTAAYKMPHDDTRRQAERVRIDYPIAIDRLLGLGVTPTLRLQRAFARPGSVNRFERLLVWCHWTWFFVPHSSVLYVLLRKPRRAVAAAARMYAVFDIGAVFYWLVPTAPPWWAAAHGHHEQEESIRVRRMMIEYGEQFWGRRWGALYDALGGNPLAAMPSLHFATSLMGAHLLSEVGPVAGALGWTYAATLGLALVYLGEHYAIDLVGGAALTESIRAIVPRLKPIGTRLAAGLQALEARAGAA